MTSFWLGSTAPGRIGILDTKSLLVLDQFQMAGICALLNKRHPNQEHTLQIGQVNYQANMNDSERFAGLGVQVLNLDP